MITGSSKGIGFSLAKKLSRFDCVLVIHGRNKTRLEQSQKLLSGNKAMIDFISADLSDSSNIDILFEKRKRVHASILVIIFSIDALSLLS